MKLRAVSIIMALIIILALFSGVQASGLICFVGINDSIPISLSAAETPYYSEGLLYIPYTAFSAGPNGVVISYDAAEGTLVLFTRTSRLVYDLEAGTVTDENDRTKHVTVLYRNGILFIPAVQAASHFGLSVSLLTSKTGCQVIRFTNGQHVYSNDEFIEKAETLISFYLDYSTKQEADNSEEPNSDKKDPDELPEEEQGPITVYLAIAGEAVSQQTLDYLEQHLLHATFFLTEKQFQEQKDLVRSIYACGHTIGLTVEAGSADIASDLIKANEAMDKAVFSRSVFALVPEGVWESSFYQLIPEQSYAKTVDAILLQEEVVPRLLVCRGDISQTIDRLMQAETVFLPLLETTILA